MVKCDYCDAPATVNIQENLITYKIDKLGNYKEVNCENNGANNHYCNFHYRKEVFNND